MNQMDLHSAEETIAQRAALARLIDGLVRDDGMHPTAIDDLYLIRCSAPSELVHGLHKPALCIIVQGSKEVRLGDELYTYDALHYLVVSVTVPVAGRVLEASSGEPYLCIRLDIDPAMVATLVAESAPLSQPVEGPARGVYLDRIDAPLLDATLRLVRLLASPQDIPVLAPLATSHNGQTLNINADTFAGAVAGALKAKRLLLLTDVPGVLDKSNKLIPELSVKDARKLIADGTISGGMIPKVETCIYALEQGVQGVVIIDGKTPHAVLLELFTNQGTGTLIHK